MDFWNRLSGGTRRKGPPSGPPEAPPIIPGPIQVTHEAIRVIKGVIKAKGWELARTAVLFSIDQRLIRWEYVDVQKLNRTAYVIANCLGVNVAVLASQASSLSSRTLYAHRHGTRRLTVWNELESASNASHPGRLALSHEKLWRFCPELYDPPAEERSWCALVVRQVAWHLLKGDSRAALVATLDPFVVAAYSDDFDAVVLLRFPGEMVTEYKLQPRGRLLCVNVFQGGERPAGDIAPGPAAATPWTNFFPIVAEFFSDDLARIQQRKAEICEAEWGRVQEFTRAALRRGAVPRDGTLSPPLLNPPFWPLQKP